MAVAFDATATANGSAVTSVSWSHTVTGANTGGIVGISVNRIAGQSDITSVTWNGAAMSFVQAIVDGDAVQATVEILQYSLIAPTTGTITVTFAASSSSVNGSVSVTGANQTTLFISTHKNTANGSGTAVSDTVTSATGELVVDTIVWNDTGRTATAGGSQTSRWNSTVGAILGGAGSTAAGAASVTMTWTLSGGGAAWAQGAISIAVAQPGPGLERRLFHPGRSTGNLARFFKTPRSTFIPASAAAGQEAINQRVTENPPYSNKSLYWKHSFQGFAQSPLSADSTGPFPSQQTETPSKLLLRRPFLQDWQKSPLSADSTGPFSKTFDLPLRRKPNPPLQFEQSPLTADSTGPFPSQQTILPPPGKTLLHRYQDWMQQPLSADFVAPTQLVAPWLDLPVKARPQPPQSWAQSPLADDSTGPFPSQQTELPLRRDSRHSFQGNQAVPLAADSTGEFTSKVFELPVRGKPQPPKDWQQTAVGPDSIGPFSQTFDLPVRARSHPVRDWFQFPLSEDSIGPFTQQTDLPVRGRLPLLQAWIQAPLPEGLDEHPSQHWGVPVAQYVRREYNGWQAAPLSADAVPPLIGLWYDNPLRGRYQPHLYAGSMLAPLSDNFVPPPSTQLFLPLVGVGS